MNNILTIYGAGGHGLVLEDAALLLEYLSVKFIDDKLNETNSFSFETLNNPAVIGIGNNQTRKKILEKHPNLNYIKLIHPTSVLSKSAIILEGSVVLALAHVGVATKIGKHVIINSCASIDHHCVIHDFVHIAPSATLCGSVIVEEGVFIGAGAVVLPGIKIGAWSTIAAGAVIINDIPPGQTYIGNPAKLK
jgi:sugar O-acyltransferase (sialic acid O-acetyltransferase NeuD family)